MPLSVRERSESEKHAPLINPADFSADITNRFFTLTPETLFVYEGQTEDGIERVEVYVTNEIKTVMGVPTRVVWDRVWLNGELIEDTRDWFSQDAQGNVWYFGEDTAELLNGTIMNHNGAWEAGINGAQPGIIMLAEPRVGDNYWQEYAAGTAEDRAEVVALAQSVTVPHGTLTGCLKTRDYTPLDLGADEHKYFCPSAGFVALEIGLEDGERIELVSVEYNAEPTPAVEQNAEPLTTAVTEEQASAIALTRVPGVVTDIALERKSGQVVFIVEIDASDGPETDVIIDPRTGAILGVEI